jgi:hypothetical protein
MTKSETRGVSRPAGATPSKAEADERERLRAVNRTAREAEERAAKANRERIASAFGNGAGVGGRKGK